MAVLNDDKGKGEEPVEFGEWVPDAMRSEEFKPLAQYKNLEEALKGFVNTKRMLGSSVRVPGENAKPEEIQEFHKKIGVPENADGYNFDLPEGYEVVLRKEVLDDIRAQAVKAGIPAKSLKPVIEHLISTNMQALSVQQEETKKRVTGWEKALRDAYGQEFEEMVSRVNDQFKNDPDVDDTIREIVKVFGLQSNPFIVKALDAKARAAKDATFSGKGAGGGPSATDIKAKIAEIDKQRLELAKKNSVANAQVLNALLAKRQELFAMLNQ